MSTRKVEYPVCRVCGIAKPRSEYHSNGSGSYRQPCATCRAELDDPVKKRTAMRAQYVRLRRQAIDCYGAMCACCGETTYEFLTLDHVNGGGTQHRKSVPAGFPIFKWIINGECPDSMQVLCANCNGAKAYYGQCPHRKEAV